MKKLTPTHGVLHLQNEDATYRLEYTALGRRRFRVVVDRGERRIGELVGYYVISVASAAHVIRYLESSLNASLVNQQPWQQ